jgi:hypothetical protein
MTALLEYEWLTGKKVIPDEELKIAVNLVSSYAHVIKNSTFSFWLQQARNSSVEQTEIFEPFQYLLDGKIHLAAAFWRKLNCSYDEALALYQGDEGDKRKALSIFLQLAAHTVAEKVKMEMRSSGIKKIPRGLRLSTKQIRHN